MHVRYLQHSSLGTVQLLLMPLSAVVGQDSFRESNRGALDEEGECEPVPLPIQSFLWRQTHPFLGSRVSKQQDASCVTFERVIVQNILHGISPSLSDAIASVSRWNLVRAAFPHIVQCCAAMLTERAGEEQGLIMSGPLVKMLYIMHWLLIDAAVECNENSLSTDSVFSIRQLTYSVASVQLFVYLLAPLFNVVREEEIEGHIRLESGLRLWQALWQQRLPELLCFSAPVKQRRNQLPLLSSSTWAKRTRSTAAEQGIYVGDKPAVGPAIQGATGRRPSQILPVQYSPNAQQPVPSIPPPKPPRTDEKVLRELEMKKYSEENVLNVPGEVIARHHLPLAAEGGSATIVRSVSDYKTTALAEQSRSQIRKSRTTGSHLASPELSPADDLSCTGIKDMEELFKSEEDVSGFDSSLAGQSGAAPLVQLKEICSSIDTASLTASAEEARGPTMEKSEQKSSQGQDQGQPTPTQSSSALPRAIPRTLVCCPSGEDSLSMSSQQTVIARPSNAPGRPSSPPPVLINSSPCIPQIAVAGRSDSEQSGAGEKAESPPISTDPHEATYLDIAVIRCIQIRNWAEEGVFWAVSYLLNRLIAMRQYRSAHEGAFRSRCNSDSAAIATRKISKTKGDSANLDTQAYLTWADLQIRTETIGRGGMAAKQAEELDGEERRGVAFEGRRQQPGLAIPAQNSAADKRRRISVNTLPSRNTKKSSRTDPSMLRSVRRSRSVPALLPRAVEMLLSFSPEPVSTHLSATAQTGDERTTATDRKTSQFFPEAIGSSTFIERNGQVSLLVVLKVLGTLMERCAVVRVTELVLNICDTLLNMPGTDQGALFPGLLLIVHRACLHLGCPNGCNEGIRTPQAEFIRVKLRNLIAQIHRLNPKRLCFLLQEQVEQLPSSQIVDALHALTVFCRPDSAVVGRQFRGRPLSQKSRHPSLAARRSSPSVRISSYKNNFNEAQSGIEGVLISAVLGPLLSKLAENVHELNQPENMGYSQDIRLLIAYVFERHGNPLRRCALSALSAKTLLKQGIEVPWTAPTTCIKSVFSSNPTLAPPQRDSSASLRRGLFRKRELQTTLSNVEALGAAGGGTGDSDASNHSTPPPQLIPSSSVDDSLGSPQQMLSGKKAKVAVSKSGGGGRLQFALNLFKGGRTTGSDQANSEDDDGSLSNAAEEQQTGEDDGSMGGSSFDAGSAKGRAKVATLRSLITQNQNRLATPKSQFGADHYEERTAAEIVAQQKSIPSFLPPRKLVQIKELRNGAARFSFLLESNRPGSFPDPLLVAALPELKSPVLARAILLLECANFVYRCNRGDWPDWIRSGMPFPGQLRSFGGGSAGSIPPQTPIHPQSSLRFGSGGSASRRTALLQRALGRSFYAWAVQLGIRLQRQLDLPEERSVDRRQLKLLDELEDFLDDGTVNNATGDFFPAVLQLLVCVILQQITAFLRETFQTLPRSRLSQKNASINTNGWERLQTHRRWSILSNTFNPQMQQQQQPPLGSGSIHSINELHPERRISYSTADEENSPRDSHELVVDEQAGNSHADKGGKVRRLAQGRQRLLKRNSPSAGATVQTPPASAATVPPETGSKKRESLRIRKISKSTGTGSTAIHMEDPEPMVVSEFVPLMRRGTADSADPVKQQQQRVVSFVQRRRRTASFKSRVSRPLNARNSMRITRTTTADEDLEAGNILELSQKGEAGGGLSAPLTPQLAASQGSRSPIFMLSIARKAKPGPVRLRPGVEQPLAQPLPSPERLSTSTGTSLQQQQQMEQAEEEDEEEMLKTMPWLKTLLKFSERIDFACPHEHFCSRWCIERVQRQCHRLTEALVVIYGQSSSERRVDRRQQFIERWQNSQQRDATKRHSSNPPRRESANVRQSGVDRMPMALRGLIFEKLNEIEESKARKAEQETDSVVDIKELLRPRLPPVVGFLRVHLLGILHSPLSALLKGFVVLTREQLAPAVQLAWNLLNRTDDFHLTTTAAALFICCAVKCPQECTALISTELASPDPSVRTSAIRRFYTLWRQRFHVWLKMEDGAQLIFKVPPPSIDFTLPSPSIGQSQLPVVDPPWMPPVKTKVEELSLKEEEQSTSQTIMTMTRTRRKQKQEMVRKAVRRAEERQRELREQFPIRATGVVQQAAYEPALFQHQLMADAVQTDESAPVEPLSRQMVPVAQPLFPSSILSVVPTIVELLDDPQVDSGGVTVSETCRKVIWSCLVEDTALFLRHFFEKFTNRSRQEYMIALLRRLIFWFRPLPSQTAHSLLNALFGLVMFYVRTPGEGTERSLGLALSLCWLVIPYVQGLYFKDLKQTLKKEQCDQAIMITANVPSAKKVIVHGPDSQQGGIPTQFPVLEETRFRHLLGDSIDFYNIGPAEADNFFLFDPKTVVLHSPSAFVRDFYFFHRSFYPQLQLVRLEPEVANQRIREHAFQQKMIEMGKVLLTHNALRHSPESVVPQRIFFLHDEFTHLPSFPRRALESCFGMYQGPGGEELQTMDAMHKFAWSKLMATVFERMENVFMFGDLHLFINVINGVMIIHCEDMLVLRRCMAAYISMSIHFQSLFASHGFFLIMPTILRCYSQRQPNRLFTQVVEFVCKQFYILHRKPFLLQMFGSVADILDQNESDLDANPMRVKAKYLFTLLLAMERSQQPVDQLDVLSLLPYPKPLQALDLCYRDDPNTFVMLTDAMASCVTICAFAPESRRSHQMLLCMQSIMPHLLAQMEEETSAQANSPSALKHELSAFATMGVEMRALVNSCDVLARGPTRSFGDLPAAGGTSASVGLDQLRGRSFMGAAERADSPQFFDPPTFAEEEASKAQHTGQSHSSAGGTRTAEKKITSAGGWSDGVAMADNELQKEQFRGPRDGLLALCAMFLCKGSARVRELGRLSISVEHGRLPELLDHKCHVKMTDIAVALLKLAPYDLNTLCCAGLREYFAHVLPVVDWSVETNRSAINMILRRLDKTIAKIAKKMSTRRRANWTAVSCWLDGLYHTLLHSPYIAHLHSLKTITLLCLRLTLGDILGPSEEPTGPQQPHISRPAFPQTILSPHIPSASFCSVVLKLTSFLMTALNQFVFSLELICATENLGSMAERPEALLCQFLIPLFLRAAIPGKESPQFQAKDITFCLLFLQNSICPPLAAKPSVVPAVSGSSLATSLMRDTTGVRQGSLSVTGGAYATVSSMRVVRESVVQAVMLALKAIVLSFYKQLTVAHWLRISRIAREIVAKKGGGAAFGSFLRFMLNANLPISEVLQPVVQSKLNQRPANEADSAWQNELKERLAKVISGGHSEHLSRSHLAQLRGLHRELQLLREDFMTRNLEIPRSHTPTIGGEFHSDSGSSHSGIRESRRLSSSTALGKLRWIQSRGGGEERGPKNSFAGQTVLQDRTIPEDSAAEEECAGGGQRVNKSPSLPFSRGSVRNQSLGMLRRISSARRKPPRMVSGDAINHATVLAKQASVSSRPSVEMQEVGGPAEFARRPTVSGRSAGQQETGEVAQEGTELSTPSQTSLGKLGSELSGGERPRVVSFSTPRHSSVSQTISEADSETEFCITSTKHII